MLSEQFISELKMRNDIEDVVGSYVNVKRRGRNLVGLCPFHSEKTPSFTVYPDSQSFYCFGCGAGGMSSPSCGEWKIWTISKRSSSWRSGRALPCRRTAMTTAMQN